MIEMLSEHTARGHGSRAISSPAATGFLSTYEAFVHVIDSMFNQHAKWLDMRRGASRGGAPISSLNLLITSTVWRQDHNGFTHQDPGFLDVVAQQEPDA